MRLALATLFGIAAATYVAPALAEDAAAALDELKQGYALKQAGNCRDALPHLARSFELDPRAKAALNMADCEVQSGDLVAAQGHAAVGRQMALEQKDAELVAVADQQLADIAKRLPHLTVRLAPEAPANSTLSLDGRPLAASSLGVASPVNAGAHRIVVSALGREDAVTNVRTDEGAAQVVEVAPGAQVVRSSHGPAESNDGSSPDAGSSHLLAFGVGGAGVVGLLVGIGAGLAASSKHDTLVGECQGNACHPTAQRDLDDFRSLKTVSTVAYVVGALGVAVGGVLWLTAPRAAPDRPAARLWLGPASAGLAGSF